MILTHPNLFSNNVITYNGTLTGLSSSSDTYITSNLTVVNDASIDQTELNNGDITLSYKITSFNF